MTDPELLTLVSAAFAAAPRPDRFTNRECCDECRELDGLLRSRTPGSIAAEDVRAGTPPSLMTPEGFRYYLPAGAADRRLIRGIRTWGAREAAGPHAPPRTDPP